MMALVANVDADIVEKGCIFQPLALAVCEAVNHPCLVEERNREARDLVRMFRPVVAPFAKLDDAAAADIGIAVGLRDLLAMLRAVVEDQSLTERQIAKGELGRAATTQER